MKWKRKIMAIWIILLIITMPFGIAQASETSEKENKNEIIPIEIATIDSDEILKTETLFISEQELVEFQKTISKLFDKIQSAENFQEIENTLNNFLGKNKLGKFTILKLLLSKFFAGRTYVLSSGHGYKYNPLKKGSIKIRKKISFWHYSSGKLLKDRTIILKPLALKLKILKGSQFGVMTRFTGMFIYVARKFPQKSYTFFMGIARRANGIQTPFSR